MTQLEHIQQLVSDDMTSIEQLLAQHHNSTNVLTNHISRHIIQSGGKRLRPLVLTLVAHACGYQDSQHIPFATALELIHTATLLHDDVIDSSQLRRGSDSANSKWGNCAPILVGDFLYSRAFPTYCQN